MDRWLDRLHKLITIIRPKAYNVIAKTIVFLGATLVAESQLNIIQAVVVALYESLMGHSDILRELISSATSPWVGIFLITIGLIYHYFMTTGKSNIESNLALTPKRPDLKLQLLNADQAQYGNETINLRGRIVNIPSEDEIPEHEINYDFPDMKALSSILNSVSKTYNNPAYYKERAEFLKIWGGSELIKLRIYNNSEFLVTGVEIEIRFQKLQGISALNTQEDFPVPPSPKIHNQFELTSPLSIHTTTHYDIKSNHTHSEYSFYWEVGEIQANTHQASNTYIFLRSEISTDIELTVLCDQLPSPMKKTYKLVRENKALDICIADLKSGEEEFAKLVNTCVMDGYIERMAKKKIAEYEHESQEFLPRS